jgi:hypothetical protein
MKRSAILFGINSYPQSILKNAANDAQALSEKLQELGFDTKCIVDADASTMHRELVSFQDVLKKSNIGLFFFAGHGIQCKGENFLMTVDTSFVDEISCKYTAIPLNEVIEIFEDSGVNTKILILDACRDNPFIRWRSTTIEGLAPVYAPKGTIIAFSTSPGQKASDGNNEHGIYTNALLMHIGTPKISIEDMFKRVRNTVSSHTSHNQITWEHTSLMGTFSFNSGYDENISKTKYSDNALADNDYIFDEDNEIQSIVDGLKSHNWYSQNPAMRRLDRATLENAQKDELFILGRNIYQAACGDSGNAVDWIDNLDARLSSYKENTSVHILNGILFEIYFDREGKLRRHFKTDCFEKPVRICQKEKYQPCRAFIHSHLEPYPQRIVYVPGASEVLSFDVTLDKSDNYYLVSIFFDGLACLYDEDGSELYQPSQFDYNTRESTIKELEQLIIAEVAVPTNKVKVSYNVEIRKDDIVEIPYRFQLLRYVQ